MSQDEVIKLISERVEQMNERGLDNAQTQGKMLEAINTIKDDIKEMKLTAHPPGCLTERLIQAEEIAKDARKIAESARLKVAGFKAGKGMTGREKWGLAGIGTAIVTLVEVIAKIFGK